MTILRHVAGDGECMTIRKHDPEPVLEDGVRGLAWLDVAVLGQKALREVTQLQGAMVNSRSRTESEADSLLPAGEDSSRPVGDECA